MCNILDFFNIDKYTGTFSSKIHYNDDHMPILNTNESAQYKFPIDYIAYKEMGCENLYFEKLKSAIEDYLRSTYGKITEVRIPEGIKVIDSRAFDHCSSLRDVYIRNGVEVIGDNAFSGTAIEKINIPKSVNIIAPTAFVDTKHLTEITVDTDNLKYISLNGNLYYLKGNPPSGDGLILIKFTRCEETPYNLADDVSKSVESNDSQNFFVTAINDWSFCGCEALCALEIPSTVNYIGNCAFLNCISLSSIQIPDDAKFDEIGIGAFAGCKSLTSVKIPKGVKTIPKYAFYGCTKLQSVEIPDSVTSIEEYAFYGCNFDGLLKFNKPAYWTYMKKENGGPDLGRAEIQSKDANVLLKDYTGKYGIERLTENVITEVKSISNSHPTQLY